MLRINDNWEFVSEWTDDFFNADYEAEKVRIPHTVKELPLHYCDSNDYQMVCGYRRKLFVEEELKGKHLFLQFDACAHIAKVYINKEHGEHRVRLETQDEEQAFNKLKRLVEYIIESNREYI